MRTAWLVISEDAEFNYGSDRGVVSVSRGGWLYKSDEDDFGVINPEKKHEGHVEAGPVAEVGQVGWRRRFERKAIFLTFLPPVLTFLALLSFGLSSQPDAKWIPGALTGLEMALLFAGVGSVLWMRRKGWSLKAAISAGIRIALEFQLAAEMLRKKGSSSFPHMTLWRAAQMDAHFSDESVSSDGITS